MTAELIVINGPLAGTRYPLGNEEVLIGRAPNAQLVLSEPDISWRHCHVRQQGGRFLASDLRTSLGTYVNGIRSAERWLEDRDQIGVGRTVLLFRSGEATAEDCPCAPTVDTKPALLAACSLVFMFRALASSSSEAQTTLLQEQLLRVIGDLIPLKEGVLLLGRAVKELLDRCSERATAFKTDFSSFVPRICEEGAIQENEAGVVGVSLYLEGLLGGILIVKTQGEVPRDSTVYLDTLTAVASLASVGFEANQEIEILKVKNALLQEQISSNTGIVGTSMPIRKLLDLIERLAPLPTTILITGESGTGKELIARALHQKSLRHERPFVAVNCAALSESLFESELFGHEKGAFTGAIALKKGRFEVAQGGTIFLDEVGELALSLQAKLLRVLQQREIERVGGTQSLKVDVRVIAATNRDLAVDVREKKFREDLYHRLNVVTLFSPPLRERKDDIPLLAEYFLGRSAETCKRRIQGFSPEASEMLMQYWWPGNVRELENAIERAVAVGETDVILPEQLPDALIDAAPKDSKAKYHQSLDETKREQIIDAYVQAKGDYKVAARLLGLHPNYLLRLVRNLNLREDINRALGNNGGAAAAGR
ncbi:MAG: sigma 54-interacting transcriptional regulator [Acidobacteriota bacterium]|nr:sigma 54-interacting transcriptional regulator [Acidobacteriota bacterium]